MNLDMRRKRSKPGRAGTRRRSNAGGKPRMNTLVTGAETAAPSRNDWTALGEQWLRAYKGGLDTLLALSNATLMGVERMEMAQLAADVETQTRNRTAALAVADCRDVTGLLALQTNLVRGYLESSMRYWSAIAELVQQTNAEIAKVLAGHGREWARAWQRAAGGDATAMRQVLGVDFAKPLLDAFDALRASQQAMFGSLAPSVERERAAA
jgi:hypothetical protein